MQNVAVLDTEIKDRMPERIERKATILRLMWNELVDEAQKTGNLDTLNDSLSWMEFYFKGARSLDDPLNWGLES